MVTNAQQVPRGNERLEPEVARKQIRGSSLLLGGRGISIWINFATQVLMVRYLSKSDYGAWAYTMGIIGFMQPFATLGLRRSITRFIPIYHENDEYDKVIGTIVLVLCTIVVVGLIAVGSIYAWPGFVTHLINDKNYDIQLLLILILLVPVEAVDGAIIGLFASFARPRVIFVRRYIVAPILKLSVVLLLVLLERNVFFLAYGYLLVSLVGVLIYARILVRLLQQQGIFAHFNPNAINIPGKEIFAFTIPLLTSDLVMVAMHSADTLMLGYFHDTEAVASYSVILPLAHINTMVMTSFGLLYTPVAARLFAKKDYAGINELYWRTAIWLAILTFPIFILTFAMATPLTSLLYGERYEESWVYLQILAVSYYFHAILGFNGLTLKVLGKVRYVVVINVVAMVANVILNLLLIPRYGALGATIATAVSIVIHNVLKQTGLKLASGISVFDPQYFPLYMIIGLCAVGLYVMQLAITGSVYVLLPLAALVSLFVLRVCQSQLNLEQTFPEIVRVPFARFVFNLGSK